jgi:Barstar (barnase inhibitor)
MDLTYLTKTAKPWLHICPSPASDIADALCQWELAAPGKRIARIVRGRKCATVDDFFDEVAAALQFPVTFGENWDALADCLRDNSRFPVKAATAICVVDSDKLLLKGPSAAAGALAGVLSMCVEDVNAPSKPRKPRPMHVLFQCNSTISAVTIKRWQAAGLTWANR